MRPDKASYYAAALTLFDEDYQMDEVQMRMYIDFLLEKGVDGFFACGTSSEYASMTTEENLRLLEVIMEENRGRKRIIPCASTTNLHATLELIHGMEQMGIREAAVCPPYYVPMRQSDILDYYTELVKGVKSNIYLYNIPGFTTEIQFPTFCKLLDNPGIAGVKDSSGNMKNISRCLSEVDERQRHFEVMVGTDEILLGALSAGCNGSVTALAAIVPEVHHRIFSLYQTEHEYVRKLQNELTQLAVLCESLYFPMGYKIALEARGFYSRTCRCNVVEKKDAAQYDKLQEDIKKRVKTVLSMAG